MKKTIEELNKLPLNERSREMLIKVGEAPIPSCLYCVQLAIWGMSMNSLYVEEGVKEFINAMPSWSATRLMNFFMLPFGGEDQDFSWEDTKTPEELAIAIINHIENKVITHFPFYMSAE